MNELESIPEQLYELSPLEELNRFLQCNRTEFTLQYCNRSEAGYLICLELTVSKMLSYFKILNYSFQHCAKFSELKSLLLSNHRKKIVGYFLECLNQKQSAKITDILRETNNILVSLNSLLPSIKHIADVNISLAAELLESCPSISDKKRKLGTFVNDALSRLESILASAELHKAEDLIVLDENKNAFTMSNAGVVLKMEQNSTSASSSSRSPSIDSSSFLSTSIAISPAVAAASLSEPRNTVIHSSEKVSVKEPEGLHIEAEV